MYKYRVHRICIILFRFFFFFFCKVAEQSKESVWQIILKCSAELKNYPSSSPLIVDKQKCNPFAIFWFFGLRLLLLRWQVMYECISSPLQTLIFALELRNPFLVMGVSLRSPFSYAEKLCNAQSFKMKRNL